MSQQRVKREKISAASGDVLEAQIAKLRSLFPEAVVEGKIDFDKLRSTLGAAAESGPGRFSFTWAGKDDAVALLQTPSRGTLIPCPEDPLQTYLQLTGQTDAEGNLLTSNPETSGRYHSAWLSMMYPRLFLARQFLREDGVICVSIDDHEVHHLRMLMNEVFGEENFIATLIWQKMDSPSRNDEGRSISVYHDYILVYGHSKEEIGLSSKEKPEIVEGYQVTLSDGRAARRRQLRKNGKGARREDRR